jgi:hypothetical protein
MTALVTMTAFIDPLMLAEASRTPQAESTRWIGGGTWSPNPTIGEQDS